MYCKMFLHSTVSILISIFLNTVLIVESAKILGIFVLQSKSHHSINQPIVKGLAARGHEVTIISHFKSNESIPNYSEILLPNSLQDFIDAISIEDSVNFSGLWNYIAAVRGIESSSCDQVFGLDYVKKLINSNEKKIDLIIAEVYHLQCYHLLAYKLNAPLVLVSPPSILTGVDYFVGNPYNPSFTPVVVSMFTTEMSFMQRVENAFQYVALYWYQIYKFNENMDKYAREVFNMELPPSEELNRRTALAFYNNHFSFIARPKSPNVIDIAGIHIKEPKKLPKDIEDFIENSPQGVILFSFGTTIKASSISAEKLQVIKEAFSSIPQRILWRVNELNITDVPTNVKLGKWFPQRDILEHKNVIAFISHCGLFGTMEAIHTATPVIGIPFMFDQVQDANILVEKGVGVYVDYHTMDKTTLTDAIKEVITNTKYRENMQKLSKIFRDRPIAPLDEALYWSEYVLKYKGAPHMRTTAADMPLYQYLLLDVILSVICLFLAVIYSLKYLFKVIISTLCDRNPKKKKNKTY
ncbi:UDP-glucosyltransferase 2-like [Planococcus citri]|uniref:UDP-glucosyltransferase 2-like n=1 Tax=Planococcus citri TaxID=170843 RepID=UPI0031F89886